MQRATRCLMMLVVVTLIAGGCASTGSGGGGSAPSAAPAPAAPDVKNETGDNGLLTPAALTARFVDAIGGEDAIRSHSSATTKGTFGIPAMGMEGEMVIYAAAPDKLVINIELGGMGTMNNGYNGEIGWSENPMTGTTLLQGDTLEQTRQQAAFYGPLAYDELFATRETLELTEFAGESAYKTRFVTDSGTESFFYFSETSAFLIGTEGQQEGADVVAVFSDYKDFGGTLAPAMTTLQTQGMELEQKVTEVSYDDVDPSAFEPPDSVKALLE